MIPPAVGFVIYGLIDLLTLYSLLKTSTRIKPAGGYSHVLMQYESLHKD